MTPELDNHLGETVSLKFSDRARTPWGYRQLIWSFAQRDLKARFKGTTIGWAWSLVVPAATVMIYTIVFSVIFRAVPPDFGSGKTGIFAIWFLAGLVPWAFLSGAITGGMPSLLGAGPLLQKVYIPSFVPVLGTVTAILVQSMIEFGLLVVILLIVGNLSWTWMLAPLWLAIYVGFAASITYMLAIFNVFFRDLNQIVAVALQLLFFLSPIMYTLNIIPESAGPIPLRTVIEANPITQFIEGFRALLYDNVLPSLKQFGYVSLWTLFCLLLAYLVYRWRGLDVSEEL
jgi:ABC-type polysaccharide/polyol phosphate export permease